MPPEHLCRSAFARRLSFALLALAVFCPAGIASAADYVPFGSDEQFTLAQPEALLAPAKALEPWDDQPAYPFVTWVGASTAQGKGIGIDTGYSTIEWFMPLGLKMEDEMFFGDVRGLIRNDATLGANAGLGYRKFLPEYNRIWGVNAYYDYRHTDVNEFNQLGLGVESLGRWIDFRSNFYFPRVGSYMLPASNFFQGHSLMTHLDYAMTGVDAEAGVSLPYIWELQTRLFGGGYFFDGPGSKNASGWKVRAECSWRNVLAVDVSHQQDQVFGSTTLITASFRYLARLLPPQPQSYRPMDYMFFRLPEDQSIAWRLGDPVQRLQNIVLTTTDVVATTPTGGVLNFLHVVPGAAGTGTIENPYGTLGAALANPSSGTSIIYTPHGGPFVENVTLVDGARVLSNGPIQQVSTQFGVQTLPFSGSSSSLAGMPSITGNVTMANNTNFSGFNVAGGLSGAALSTVNVEHSQFTNAGNAIAFTTTTGLSLTDVNAASTAGIGIQLNDTAAALSSVSVTQAGTQGVQINNAGAARTISITDLSVANAAGQGMDVNATGAGALTLTLAGRNTIRSTGNAFDLAKSGAGNVNLSLSNTTVASASGAGMNIDGTAGAGTIFITAFANNAVTHAGAGGVLMNKVTFDSNLTTTGFQQVLAGSLTVGDQSDTTQVTGDGVRLISPTGSLSLGVLKIANDNGTGLLVNTKVGPTTFTLASLTGSEISTTNGPATNLDPLSASLQFSSLSSSNSGTSGILVDTVSGTFNSSSVFIHDSAAKSIVVKNTPATLNMNMGTTTIDSLLGPTQADNVDTSTNNGTFLNLSFTKLTINYP